MAAFEVQNPDDTKDTSPGKLSRVEFSPRLSKVTLIFGAFVCAALVVTSVFLGPKAFFQEEVATGGSPSVKAEIAKPQRSPALVH